MTGARFADVYAYLGAAGIIGAALLSARWMGRFIRPVSTSRNTAIDGLRGYLAIFVFIAHASVWQAYSLGFPWTHPANRLHGNFGTSSVSLFFMITAFLYTAKLIEAKDRGYTPDLLRFWVSRVFRLWPMYIFTVLILFVIAFQQTGWRLNVSYESFALTILKWATFTIGGDPPVNGMEKSGLIMSGAYWTLVYECIFYALLPVMSLAIAGRANIAFVFLGVAAIILVGRFDWKLLPFLGGVLAAYAVRIDRFEKWSGSLAGSIFLIAMAVIHFLMRGPVFNHLGLLPLAAGFAVVASGNTLFGIFKMRSSLILGELTYSIYLLHGIFLFVMFKPVIPGLSVKIESPMLYWVVITALTPLIIFVSALTYRFIERPPLDRVKSVTAMLRASFAPLRL